jgi:hypothetical protein
MTKSLGNVAMLLKPQDSDREIAQCRHDPGAGLCSDATMIFVVCNISDIMQLVFNSPVFSTDFKESFRTSFLRSEAGNAADNFVAQEFSGKIGRQALDPHDLLVMGKLNIFFKFIAGPDPSDFDPTMSFVHRFMLRGGKPPCGGS